MCDVLSPQPIRRVFRGGVDDRIRCRLSIVVLATGADGYRAALAWAEGSPELSATPILVAYTEDGLPLGQPRLVIPGDLEGVRYVRHLVDLRVVNLAPA
jgi:hypothetical protein